MYEGLCRRGREEGCGRQQRRPRGWHRVALDGQAARTNNVAAARKSRKGSLAATDTATATATALAATAYKILLDNTPNLLLNP